MSLQLLGHIELPGNLKPGGFDHAAVHGGSGRLYVAHTANDALDVIDCVEDRYLHSIANLTGVAGALVSDEQKLVFTSNRGENTVGIFGADTDNTLWNQPEGAGLEAIAEGFRHLGFKDDHELNAAEWIVYDALYAYCQEMVRQGKPGGMFK